MLITVYWYCFLKTVPVRKITVKAKITVPSVSPDRSSVSRLKKKNCKYEYENFSYLEKNEI